MQKLLNRDRIWVAQFSISPDTHGGPAMNCNQMKEVLVRLQRVVRTKRSWRVTDIKLD